MSNARRVVQVFNLQESLDAGKAKRQNPLPYIVVKYLV